MAARLAFGTGSLNPEDVAVFSHGLSGGGRETVHVFLRDRHGRVADHYATSKPEEVAAAKAYMGSHGLSFGPPPDWFRDWFTPFPGAEKPRP